MFRQSKEFTIIQTAHFTEDAEGLGEKLLAWGQVLDRDNSFCVPDLVTPDPVPFLNNPKFPKNKHFSKLVIFMDCSSIFVFLNLDRHVGRWLLPSCLST